MHTEQNRPGNRSLLSVLWSVLQQLETHACAGCGDPSTPPQEGDVRLVPINASEVATEVCDAGHMGGVGLFREGRWGRICYPASERSEQEFTLDAQVVCRQLGFPFGTLFDAEDFSGDYSFPNDPPPLVWASVVCTVMRL